MRHDILTVRSEGSSRYTFIDVTVPSLQSTRNGPRMSWPTDEEVSQHIEQQAADRTKRFQERNLDPPRRLHPDIEKARTFRQMSWAVPSVVYSQIGRPKNALTSRRISRGPD